MLTSLAGHVLDLRPTRKQQREVLLSRLSFQGLWVVVAFVINPLFGFLAGSTSFLWNFRQYRRLTPTGPYKQTRQGAATTAHLREVYNRKHGR